MARVVGLGLFVTSADPKALGAWYAKVLGLGLQDWNGVAFDPKVMAETPNSAQVFSFFKAGSDYLKPSTRDFMVNLCVDDMDGMLARIAEHGVEVIWQDDTDPSGRFAHFLDPEGTKVELWQPTKA